MFGIIEGLLIFIPITEIITKLLQNILGKCVKPKLIPKMDFSKGVPEEYKTMIVIPSIVSNEEDVRSLFEKLEVYYLANKSENIYCTVLGDPTSSTREKEDVDKNIIDIGLFEVERLNKKYGNAIFNFIYRKRIWCTNEKCYMGWERKRGLLTELNLHLEGKKQKNTFIVNTLEKNAPKVKYIITLDSDTELPLNSGIELIEAMSHILNRPETKAGKVVSGYGIIQPRVGINLEESKKSLFAEIFAGSGGVDSYTNAISDTYQDNFGEGIYTGKGIYDLKVFCEVMEGEIPENTVLSHDLLEGCYLRCGLASDIMLLDGFPKGYLPYLTRLSRWIRGDFQIIPWLKRIKGLNKLSRFKITDNIRRSLIEFVAILNIIVLIVFRLFIPVSILPFLIVTLLGIAIPSVLEVLNFIIFRKENIKKQKQFSKSISGLAASFYRSVINIMTLPTKAYISLNAMIKTIYRMNVTKEHLLEWTTAEEAERKSKNDIAIMSLKMIPNFVIGGWIIGCNFFLEINITFKVFLYILGILMLFAPFAMWYISKEKVYVDKFARLTKEEQKYIKGLAEKTWGFFAEYMNKENSYLPPDNFQESRREKVVYRTSSTNIGLGLLTIVSAYDLKFITLDQAIVGLENSVFTIEKLEKWNGHLYNWYNTKTLEPLIPRYVSTVDSGNFVRIYVYFEGFFRG